ncbi:MAG: type III-B CRISPR module-associated protein Cmr5 [Gammaproteobacteria bacterium]|nr:type III-B CRISPR module-associated protein Cmr5 [Gammaproteobacteria bacterium]
MGRYKKNVPPKIKPAVKVSQRVPAKSAPKQQTLEQTLEQKRAEHAWTKSAEGVALHGKDYVNSVKGLPALIMNSGLMQTLAFLQQKGGRHELLSLHLRQWLQFTVRNV